MKRHLATAGKGLAGAGLTGAVAYLVTTATVRQRPVWPYWILLAMVAAGLLFYLLGERIRSGQAGDTGQEHAAASVEDDAAPAQPLRQPGPAVTDRWRSTNDGFEVPALMRLRDHSMSSHPAYSRRSAQDSQPPPSIRIGILVACGPLGATPATSDIRASLLAFLNREPVSDLVASLTHAGPDAEWKSWGGNGRNTFSAILTGDDEAVPAAMARLLPPVEGTSFAGRDPRMAELILWVEPRAPGGATALAVNLATWRDRLVRALAVPGAFADFLAKDLGLATSDDPLAQAGVILDVPHAMTELVDIESLEPVPGSSTSTWFMGWAVADPDGKPAQALAREWLTQMCDSTLNLNGYETVLDAIGNLGQPSPTNLSKAHVSPVAKDA
jgi:hypothetical protein